MDINKYRDTKYLKKEEVEKPVLATIDHCEEQDVSMSNQAEKLRCVIFFKENLKPYIANWTALQEIHQMTGDGNADHWEWAYRLDKKLPELKIVLYLDKDVMYGTKKVGGIKVRAPRNQAPPDPEPQQVKVNRTDGPPQPTDEDAFDAAMREPGEDDSPPEY